MAAASKIETSALAANLLAELYAESRASCYGISEAEFGEILSAIAGKHIAVEASSPLAAKNPQTDYLQSLKLEDLAIARGCARGDDKAWEVFLTRYREKLFESARQITREETSARELADSIYADLFGTNAREGERVSKLSSYMGRGSLEGWLRTVLAQEWVNRYRKQKRLVSLDEAIERGAQFSAANEASAREVESPVVTATDAALSALAPEDRYILAAYYLDKRTLADIARTLGVHESTMSRKVEKLAKGVRKQILERLVRGGMSRRQAEEAMEVDVRDLSVDVGSKLGYKGGEAAVIPNLPAGMVQEPTTKAFQALEGKKE